jgi:CheY-like chemotaxis protein
VALLKNRKRKRAAPHSELAQVEFQGGGHILIAEDNLVNQEVAQGFLQRLGCRVTLAGNGEEALELSGKEPFDLIFMDCQMPKMDGYEAVRAIRSRETTASPGDHMPIIAMTAHALEGDRERCLAAGMDDYIGKPFSVEQLKTVLHKWLSPRLQQGVTAPPASAPPSGREPLEDGPRPEPLNAETPFSSAIDTTVIDQIKSLADGGSQDLLTRILQAYLSETQKLIQELIAALESSDAEVIRKTAHTLKSSSAHVGAVKLASLFKEIETKARERSLDDLIGMTATLTQEFDLVQQALTLELQKVAP